ncbi:lytic transglycosylase domain-containing protein [Paenalcaligenes niemegkensis]|uniref:lytic transglycosylase domain-containing protein n=1 Tax=Paenalcaligenes niemegkensis TaxID=2895469 RepID=UPI001EE96305|nr:lytic transglycosylase domain-containing protein [Paenalcaligenes niemegkensis]MCQ9617474.1 lytic transglycosylase domain-containing protein [Paenalcaligenes niemegkensis]
MTALALLSILGLAGCVGAQPPQKLSQKSDEVQVLPSADDVLRLAMANPAPAPATRWEHKPDVTPQARSAVLSARAALEAKRWSALPALAEQAAGDPVLGAYPRYWHLRQQLHTTTAVPPADSLNHFLRTNADHYLAERLKGDWAIAAARRGDYALVNELNPADLGNSQTRCAQHYAKHMTGQAVDLNLALEQFRPGSACWTMLDQLYTDQVAGWDDIRGLMRAAIESAKPVEARRLAAILFDGSEMKDYTSLMAAPKAWLNRQGAVSGVPQQELVTLALSRLGRESNRQVQADYIRNKWAQQLPAENLDWVWGQFGLVAALRVEPDAATWYRLSGLTRMTDYNHAWEVRAELREPSIDWRRVQASVEKMTKAQASEPVWVYWRARALQAQGDRAQAKAQFESITSDLGFYGQLASEELGRLITLPPKPTAVTNAEIAEVRSRPGIVRAIELFDLGWRSEAVSEWAFAIRGMNDRQLRAAAEIARSEHVYDRVVNTSLLTRNEIDFSQRFVAPFEGRVTEKAKLINLDPAWVYGLIRQESRFITDARSGVGASGLMQLMPGTAKWVANRIGMQGFTPSSVNDFDTNTILGTNYLNMVLQQLDGSEVLASAGYNAGPKRPVRWRSRLQVPVEGAIFAETIPFTETRLYVKNVLSNATYYSMVFTGQPQSLKQRLGVISPEAETTVALP